jgi:pimeloyl-ACP methyl ester carboxylesterase
MQPSHKNAILFVRGFNTDNIKKNDTYYHVRKVLSQSNSVTYFNYNPTENIAKVYENMCSTIRKGKFTHLIGHSMGGGLLMKYIADYPHKIPVYKKIILLMPLIYKEPVNNFIAKIPFVRNVFLPKAVILPASKLYSLGNFLNDDYNVVSLSQIVDAYHHMMLDSEKFVHLLNKHRKNIIVFYAKQEFFNTIPDNILNKIENLVLVNGLHECFNDLTTNNEFFKEMERILK